MGDRFGYFISRERWHLDQAGVYRYMISARWQGYNGHMPGLPGEGGYLFVRDSGAADQVGLQLALSGQQIFDVATGMVIRGSSTAEEVFYTSLTPGAVIDQGRIPVINGSFSYKLDPSAINRRIPIYDIEDRLSGRKETGRIIHLAFFSLERPAHRKPYYAFTRVVVRGTTVLYTP
jgi:hypothetical protein